MGGSADTAGMFDLNCCPAFFPFEIMPDDRPLKVKLEFTSDLSHSEMRGARGPFFHSRSRHIFSLAFLGSSFVATFRDSNFDSRNGACFATSRHTLEIIAPEAPNSHAVFQRIRPDSSSKGERCMQDTDHPIRHASVHLRILGRVRSRKHYAGRDDQFGRGQNTGLGWSDPTFVHVSVPKVIRGVAPAQLRGDRAECFVRAAFRSREPQ
jgi:hypothetical protein